MCNRWCERLSHPDMADVCKVVKASQARAQGSLNNAAHTPQYSHLGWREATAIATHARRRCSLGARLPLPALAPATPAGLAAERPLSPAPLPARPAAAAPRSLRGGTCGHTPRWPVLQPGGEASHSQVTSHSESQVKFTSHSDSQVSHTREPLSVTHAHGGRERCCACVVSDWVGADCGSTGRAQHTGQQRTARRHHSTPQCHPATHVKLLHEQEGVALVVVRVCVVGVGCQCLVTRQQGKGTVAGPVSAQRRGGAHSMPAGCVAQNSPVRAAACVCVSNMQHKVKLGTWG